jgi:Transcriptional regulator PadR-like family
MPPSNTNLLQGTLDVLILKVLALQPMHGLGISNRIAQVTSNTFLVKPGSLFPALHRMEEAGWLTSSWGDPKTTVARSSTASPPSAADSSNRKPISGRAFPPPWPALLKQPENEQLFEVDNAPLAQTKLSLA